jgi:hypothetical protein
MTIKQEAAKSKEAKASKWLAGWLLLQVFWSHHKESKHFTVLYQTLP